MVDTNAIANAIVTVRYRCQDCYGWPSRLASRSLLCCPAKLDRRTAGHHNRGRKRHSLPLSLSPLPSSGMAPGSLLCRPVSLRYDCRTMQPLPPMPSRSSAITPAIAMGGPVGWPPTARKPSTRKVVDRTSRRARTATDTPENATEQTTSATGQMTAALQPRTAAMQPKLATSHGKEGCGVERPIEPDCQQERKHLRQALQRR